MPSVDIDHLQAELPPLLDHALPGEAITITRAGTPLATVVALRPGAPSPVTRRLGSLEGMYTIPQDFDTMFAAEIEEMFYGEHE